MWQCPVWAAFARSPLQCIHSVLFPCMAVPDCGWQHADGGGTVVAWGGGAPLHNTRAGGRPRSLARCMRHLLTASARLHAVDALAASQPGGRSAGCGSLARAPQLRQLRLHALLGVQPAPAGCLQAYSFSGFRFIIAASCARSNYTRSACIRSSMLTSPMHGVFRVSASPCRVFHSGLARTPRLYQLRMHAL